MARALDGYSDAVTHGCTSPLSSHGSCKPVDEYPTAPRGPCNWNGEAGVPGPLPTGPPVLLPLAGSPPE